MLSPVAQCVLSLSFSLTLWKFTHCVFALANVRKSKKSTKNKSIAYSIFYGSLCTCLTSLLFLHCCCCVICTLFGIRLIFRWKVQRNRLRRKWDETRIRVAYSTLDLGWLSLVPRRSLLICSPCKVWERADEYLSVTSQLMVESRNDRAENAGGLGWGWL